MNFQVQLPEAAKGMTWNNNTLNFFEPVNMFKRLVHSRLCSLVHRTVTFSVGEEYIFIYFIYTKLFSPLGTQMTYNIHSFILYSQKPYEVV